MNKENRKEDKKCLGEWEVKRLDKRTIQIVLPEGMYVDGDGPLSLDDVKDLLDVYIESGPVTVKCCHGRTAIA